MSEITKLAKAKIESELKSFKGGQKAKAVSSYVATTLKNFCGNEIFAKAVIEQKKTLSDCCEQIMKSVGNSISDIQVYRKATAFYFPTAKIDFKMEIVINGEFAESDEVLHGAEDIRLPEQRKTKREKKDKSAETIQLTLF
ncbi:hypothetical protein [Anaerovorax sp. IOR16]|uniref:hypothetical protein n=1 Tax=Anaerovorax sp. IOR16 TaxID=2773458 RepID=UPI0019D1C20C|nr:hypothetical protein [Anaerovorax sp. IOR16]